MRTHDFVNTPRSQKRIIGLKKATFKDVCYGISFIIIAGSVGHSTLSQTIKSTKPQTVYANFATVTPTPTSTPVGHINEDGIEIGVIHYEINPFDVKHYVQKRFTEEFGSFEWKYAEKVITNESGFNPKAVNKSSGACGLFQALPCSKLPCELEDYQCQTEWGVQYFRNRYQTPSNAWEFHLANGWY